MTITLKAKAPLVVPPSVQRKARLKAGDRVEFKATPGRITIVSKPPAVPSATDDEYTPEQRRIIERQIAEGLEDIKKGRTHGPFNTVEEMIASMKAGTKTSRRHKTPDRTRARVKLARGLPHLRKETARINRLIEKEFERIEPEESPAP